MELVVDEFQENYDRVRCVVTVDRGKSKLTCPLLASMTMSSTTSKRGVGDDSL